MSKGRRRRPGTECQIMVTRNFLNIADAERVCRSSSVHHKMSFILHWMRFSDVSCSKSSCLPERRMLSDSLSRVSQLATSSSALRTVYLSSSLFFSLFSSLLFFLSLSLSLSLSHSIFSISFFLFRLGPTTLFLFLSFFLALPLSSLSPHSLAIFTVSLPAVLSPLLCPTLPSSLLLKTWSVALNVSRVFQMLVSTRLGCR